MGCFHPEPQRMDHEVVAVSAKAQVKRRQERRAGCVRPAPGRLKAVECVAWRLNFEFKDAVSVPAGHLSLFNF
jgi:hypothetical protein